MAYTCYQKLGRKREKIASLCTIRAERTYLHTFIQNAGKARKLRNDLLVGYIFLPALFEDQDRSIHDIFARVLENTSSQNRYSLETYF